MKEMIPDLKRWLARGDRIAVATIVDVRGSSLRPAGSRMFLNDKGEVLGSVSSGCVDGDIIAEMEAVLDGRFTLRRPYYEISDEMAWAATLACGGSLDVVVEPWDETYARLVEEVEADRPVGLATLVSGTQPRHLLRTASGEVVGTLDDTSLDETALTLIAEQWPGPFHRLLELAEGTLFVEVIPPPLTLLVFGATDIARSLVQMAKVLGFRIIVSDARQTFLNEQRFPEVERRFGWPQEVFTAEEIGPGWAVVILFHDAKFDLPALALALRSEAFYVGFLGSRTTQADRRRRLREMGFSEAALQRIHGPIGLKIGGREPGMIALSILAEVVAVRHGEVA